MFRRSIFRLRWVAATGVVIVAMTMISSAPAEALTKTVKIHVYNKTQKTLLLGSLTGVGLHQYLSPNTSWTSGTGSKEVSVNILGFVGNNTEACGELKFSNPALGFPKAELYRRAEDPGKGIGSEHTFSVNESHTFNYSGSKLVVKRLEDGNHRDVDEVFGTSYKVFDLYIEKCPG